jgi:hypothetical protein
MATYDLLPTDDLIKIAKERGIYRPSIQPEQIISKLQQLDTSLDTSYIDLEPDVKILSNLARERGIKEAEIVSAQRSDNPLAMLKGIHKRYELGTLPSEYLTPSGLLTYDYALEHYATQRRSTLPYTQLPTPIILQLFHERGLDLILAERGFIISQLQGLDDAIRISQEDLALLDSYQLGTLASYYGLPNRTEDPEQIKQYIRDFRQGNLNSYYLPENTKKRYTYAQKWYARELLTTPEEEIRLEEEIISPTDATPIIATPPALVVPTTPVVPSSRVTITPRRRGEVVSPSSIQGRISPRSRPIYPPPTRINFIGSEKILPSLEGLNRMTIAQLGAFLRDYGVSQRGLRYRADYLARARDVRDRLLAQGAVMTAEEWREALPREYR